MDVVSNTIDGLQNILTAVEDTWNQITGVVADVTNIEGMLSGIITGLLGAAIIGGISYAVYHLFQG